MTKTLCKEEEDERHVDKPTTCREMKEKKRERTELFEYYQRHEKIRAPQRRQYFFFGASVFFYCFILIHCTMKERTYIPLNEDFFLFCFLLFLYQTLSSPPKIVVDQTENHPTDLSTRYTTRVVHAGYPSVGNY